MNDARAASPTPRRPLRLWPGVLLAALACVTWFVLPIILPGQGIYWMMATVAAGLGIVVWWAFFSRAPHLERWGAVLLMIVALAATSRVLHVSVSNAGRGMLFIFLAIPLLSFVFVVGVLAGRRLADRPRRAVMVAAILLASGGWALVRIGGINPLDFAWRWSATPEERLLVQAGAEPPATAGEGPAGLVPSPRAVETSAEWPGFRGPDRNGVVPGVRIETDWTASPPVELWRRPIGPGWSSVAVDRDRLYTQEQRGDHEVVASYEVKTGEPVWMHRDATRFWEANAGPGPRATPTLDNGRVYTLGATGVVNALDAASGAVVWSRNAASDTGAKAPYWGFAGSPLAIDDVVIVAASGKLVAYESATGNPRWFGPAGGVSYSSPHLLIIDGVAQVLLLGQGAISVAPADGAVLWEHAWAGFTMVQPALTADGDVLISDESLGIRRIVVTHEPGGWTATERWTSTGLKPNFNDYVVHRGHAFGFDGNILACIGLEDGQRKWKGGRYGNGQLVLLSGQDLLLVLSDRGELALVAATPERFREFARFPAIEGKTWNHPVVVGDLLLVRNDQEMAAFRLPLAAVASR